MRFIYSRLCDAIATASAAAPSSRPTKPIPSPRVALTLTCSSARPSAAAEPCADLLAHGRELRALDHHRGVDVADREAAAPASSSTVARSSSSESASR